MAHGLSVGNIVNVDVNLSPMAAGKSNFGALLILGASAVIDGNERIRLYTALDGVAADFGTDAPEYQAADLFFSQSPRPNLLYIGRWAQNATSGLVHGGVLTPTQQALANFTAVTAGVLRLDVDGVTRNVSGLDFSAARNLNGVASIIDAALTGANVAWDSVSGRFTVTSDTTGLGSSVGYASDTGAGTDISALIKLAAGSASPPVDGVAAETLLEAVQTLADKSSQWYGLTVATATQPGDAAHIAVAGFIEASAHARIYGVTITSTTVLDAAVTDDLASQLKALGYKRSFTQYSSSSPYAVAALCGRAFTVDFEASKTTITLKFKQEPGVVAETITESQAATLKSKCCNVFVNYDNDTAIIQEGVMANGYFFDEVHGTDWLQNAVETDVFNLLYQSPTKIPQSDEGTHLIVTTIEDTLARAVGNGLVAPGRWNVGGFGQLRQGDTLSKGFYVYASPLALQSQADRESLRSVPIQVAAKLAGAIHSTNVLINVNR